MCPRRLLCTKDRALYSQEGYLQPDAPAFLASKMEPLLPKNAHILDVGTGDGTIAAMWQHNRPDIRIEGIDVLVRSQTKIPVRKFDGCVIPFADKVGSRVIRRCAASRRRRGSSFCVKPPRVARSWVIIKDHYAENAFDLTTLRIHGLGRQCAARCRFARRLSVAGNLARHVSSQNLEPRSLEEQIALYIFSTQPDIWKPIFHRAIAGFHLRRAPNESSQSAVLFFFALP